MKRTLVALMGALCLSGCATIADLRYPLPKPEGDKRQLNRGLWQWENSGRSEWFGGDRKG